MMKNNRQSESARHHECARHHDHDLYEYDLFRKRGNAHNHKDQATGGQHTHTHTHTNSKAVLNRLSKLIGHLNAVKTMVESGRDCSEVLIQLAAVRSAINGTCKNILKDHIDHCIVDAVETGDTETIEELNKAIEILMK